MEKIFTNYNMFGLVGWAYKSFILNMLVHWIFLLGYCYTSRTCDDRLFCSYDAPDEFIAFYFIGSFQDDYTSTVSYCVIAPALL